MLHLVVLNWAKNLTWKGWTAVAVLLVVLALMSQCAVNKVMNSWGDNKQVVTNNEDRELRDTLSEKRLDTETKISTQERQLNEELAKIPTGVPSDRRIARACHELRSDGGHVELPSVCRPEAN